ncbi:MAG: FAD-binding protein [Myxococcales bacterium]|nr:FAD-binding protein [Myxococcales bacterium]
MSTPRRDAEVVVIGGGAAGLAAARAAHEAGASALIVAESQGALAMASGVLWGAAREPFARWSAEGPWQRGGRYVTAGALQVSGVAGALSSLLNLDRVREGAPLGVVDLGVHPAWQPRLLAQTLGGRVVPCGFDAGEAGFGAAAMRLDTEGLVATLAASLAEAVDTVGGFLFPPVLGLKRHDVAAQLERLLGRPVGEVAGAAGEPPGLRMAAALQAWVPRDVGVLSARARVEPGRVAKVVLANGESVRARAVVLATGGLVGGGLRFASVLEECTAGLPVWTARHERILSATGAARGADPVEWFAPREGRAFGAGLRLDAAGRVLDADGQTRVAPWLFAAGEVALARDGDGIAGALASGHRAGAEAARFARGS